MHCMHQVSHCYGCRFADRWSCLPCPYPHPSALGGLLAPGPLQRQTPGWGQCVAETFPYRPQKTESKSEHWLWQETGNGERGRKLALQSPPPRGARPCLPGRPAGLELLLSGKAARLPTPPKMWPSKSGLRIPLKIPVCGPAKLLGREENTSQGANFGAAPRRGQLRYLLRVSCVL